jgi:hypothetical protein
MKIYEIITENKLDERLGLIRMAARNPEVRKALSKGADALAKKVGQGDNFKAAKRLYLRGGRKFFNPITKTMQWTGYVASALKGLGLMQIAIDYRDAIARGEKELAEGRWTQEQFDDYHKNQMGTLITQIALAGPFFLALKVSTGWSLFTMAAKYSRNPAAIAVGTTMATMATGVQAAFIQLLNTKESRLAIAEYTANTFIDNTLADYAISGVQKVKGMIGLAEKKATGTPTSEPADADKTTTPDSTSDSDKKSEPPKGDYEKSGLDPRFKGISPNKAS